MMEFLGSPLYEDAFLKPLSEMFHSMTKPISELSTETKRNLESFITEWVNDNNIPGASIAVVRDNNIIYADGFGARDLSKNDPATRDTLYGIGSCTKSFTTLSIMQLTADGLLDPSDAVSEYVPYLEDVQGRPITIHELMTHSSGMPSDGSAVVLIARLMGTKPIETPLSSEQDFRRHLEGSLPERVLKDDQFFYYNSGFTILGHLIESVDGREFDTYVEEEILKPLGMTRSTFSMENVANDLDGLTPYYMKDGESVEGNFPDDEMIYAPGGLLSSVTELTAYLRMNMNDGSYEGANLIDSDLLAKMHERYSTRQVTLDGTPQDYGYGWMISELGDEKLIGHGGSIGVSNAYLGFLKDSGIGVAVACNTSPKTHPMFVGPAVLSIVNGKSPAESVPLFALRDKLETITGEYKSYRGIQSATVEQDGGTLALELSTDLRSESLHLIPESLTAEEFRFYTVAESGYRVPVEFDVSEESTHVTIKRWRLEKQN